MRFKTDENLPAEFAEELRSAGWDALSVSDQQLSGSADAQLAAICMSESRVLVTLDIGFGNIKAYPPATHAGIIVLRLIQQDKQAVLAFAQRVIRALLLRPIRNELWVVDERRIRIRS